MLKPASIHVYAVSYMGINVLDARPERVHRLFNNFTEALHCWAELTEQGASICFMLVRSADLDGSVHDYAARHADDDDYAARHADDDDCPF